MKNKNLVYGGLVLVSALAFGNSESVGAQEVPGLTVNVESSLESNSISVGGGGGTQQVKSGGINMQGVLNTSNAPSGYPANSLVIPNGCGETVVPVTNNGSYGLWILSFSTPSRANIPREVLYRSMLCEVYGGRATQYLQIMRGPDTPEKRVLIALLYEYLYQETGYFDNMSESEMKKFDNIYLGKSNQILDDQIIKGYIASRRQVVREIRSQKSNDTKVSSQPNSLLPPNVVKVPDLLASKPKIDINQLPQYIVVNGIMRYKLVNQAGEAFYRSRIGQAGAGENEHNKLFAQDGQLIKVVGG